MSSDKLFSDKDVNIRKDMITLKGYYFPLGISKKIPLS